MEDVEVTAIVNGALHEMRAGLYTGIAAKGLGRLGDEIADSLLRSYSLHEMSTKPMSIATAQAIAASFGDGSLLVKAADRDAKISILLLTYLRASVNTQEEMSALDLAMEVVHRQVQARAGRE